MPNLIVILFNLLYLAFYVGFHCKDCVCERVTQGKLKIKKVFAGSSQETFLQSEACAQHMTGMRRVMTNGDNWFSRVFQVTDVYVQMLHSFYIRCE